MHEQTSILFKIKDTADIDNHRILEIFFRAWVDEICNNEVQYRVVRDVGSNSKLWQVPGLRFPETFRVDFDRKEDAIIVKLKGIPEEFQNYLEFVN
jgi:hypothetical protein